MDIIKATNLIKKHEGFRSFPYKDQFGKITIGYGCNIEDEGLTQDEAVYLLNNRINNRINALNTQIPWWLYLTDNRKAVLLDMAYQLGTGGLMKFQKMLVALKAGNYDTASKELLNSDLAKQTPSRAEEDAYLLKNG